MTPLSGPDFWGIIRRHEPAEQTNLRDVTPFAVELARELAKADTIRRDPFMHLPAELRPAAWAVIVRKTSENVRPYYRGGKYGYS